MRRPASLAQVRPLDQAHARIDGGRVDRRHVRRRNHPRQPRVAPPHRSPPAAHRNHHQVAIELKDFVEVARQLARRHGVTRRQREHPYETRELLLANVAFEMHAVDRIGPVQHDHLHACLGSRAHAKRHRVDEGVVARADVLQIDHQRVEIAQQLAARRKIVLARAVE